ncbi:MAG: YceI family protein [Candidatus Nitrotoga sp.]
MKRRTLFAILIAGSLPFSTQAADSFTVDPDHTFPHFSVSHLGFSTMQGRFDASSGKITLDSAAKKGTIEFSIKAASINTGHAKRDEHLRSPDFFNAAEYPSITFKSTAIKFEGDKPASVEGNLTLLGVSKPVKLNISAFNCGLHPMDPTKKKFVCGADASTQIKRSDFGMKYGVPAVGDDIKLVFEVEAIRD